MSMTLRNSDARAVDLILDRAAMAAGTSGTMLFAGDPGVSSEQVAAVERVLHLLDAMPAAEPPTDLVRRTLDRIEAGETSPAMHRPHREMIDASRPVA